MALQTGKQGAKVQSWKAANPRDLLRRLIEESPKADRDDILEGFRAEVRRKGNDEMLDVLIEYWFANNYHSLTAEPRQPAQKMAAKAESQARVTSIKRKVAAHIEARAEERAQVILLDMMMPNGKRLADCTGADCVRLSNRVGTWLGRLGAELRPSELVGDVLDESEVRRLYGRPEKGVA